MGWNAMETDTVLNNIIAYYGLLVAIVLPVIIFLVESVKDSPKIDKQILFKKVFPLKHLGILLGFFILPGIQFLLFNSNLLENVWAIVIVSTITALTTAHVFYSVSQMMAWILSGEKKEAFHNFYRRNSRREFLDSGTTEEKCDKWAQFWSDERTMKYFGNDICNYIDDFFIFLHSLEKEDWEYAKKSCAGLYYNIVDLYKIGKKGIKINAYDYESFTRQLIETVPFSICYNLTEYVHDSSEEEYGMFMCCGIILMALLDEMEKDNDLTDNNDWMTAFNIYFFGVKRERQKALAVIMMLIACYQPGIDSKRNINKRIKKLMVASDNKYAKFYKELYKEMFDFNPKKSTLLRMLEKDG